jgi:hypothetical protein
LGQVELPFPLQVHHPPSYGRTVQLSLFLSRQRRFQANKEE